MSNEINKIQQRIEKYKQRLGDAEHPEHFRSAIAALEKEKLRLLRQKGLGGFL